MLKKTVCGIIDSNLEKDNDISIVFDRNIFDTTGYQMAVQIPKFYHFI